MRARLLLCREIHEIERKDGRKIVFNAIIVFSLSRALSLSLLLLSCRIACGNPQFLDLFTMCLNDPCFDVHLVNLTNETTSFFLLFIAVVVTFFFVVIVVVGFVCVHGNQIIYATPWLFYIIFNFLI